MLYEVITKTMAAEFGLKLTSYNMFKGNAFDVEDFKSTLQRVMDEQGRVLVIINDPCHNPSGYTMSGVEWDQVIDFVNELGKQGPVVILNDIVITSYSIHYTKLYE